MKATLNSSLSFAAFLLLSALLFLTLPASGEETWDDWQFGVDTVIKYTGSATSVTIPRYNPLIVPPDDPVEITEIEYNAFKDNSTLTAITIPDSITKIGFSAFRGCTSLQSVAIPDSVQEMGSNSFKGCTALSSVSVGSGLGTIEAFSFSYCPNLTTLSLSEGLHTIETWAFGGCEKITTIEVPQSVNTITSHAFSDCKALETIHLPNTLNVIADGLFSSCISLKTIQLPPTLQEIEDSAFENSGLTEITLGPSVRLIGSRLFFDCDSLTTVNLSASQVEVIPVAAFSGCDSLDFDYVQLPSHLSVIDERAFSHCPLLRWVDLSKVDLQKIGVEAFLLSGLTRLKVPDGLTHIGRHAFAYTGLESLDLPASVTLIDLGAFRGCEMLAVAFRGTMPTTFGPIFEFPSPFFSIFVPKGQAFSGEVWDEYNIIEYIQTGDRPIITGYQHLTSHVCLTSPDNWYWSFFPDEIADEAFENCSVLQQVLLPKRFGFEIGDRAFKNCTNLFAADRIQPKYDTGPIPAAEIGEEAFAGCVQLQSFGRKDAAIIKKRAFAGCSSLATMTDTWDEAARYGVARFTEAEFIGEEAFQGTGFWVVEIDSPKLTDIGSRAFQNCPNLYYAIVNQAYRYVEGAVQSMGQDVFLGCSPDFSVFCEFSPEHLFFGGWTQHRRCEFALEAGDNSLVSIIGVANVPAGDRSDHIYGTLKIPSVFTYEGVDREIFSIEANAFRETGLLTHIEIPDSVVSIDEYAFSQSGLLQFTFSGHLLDIGDNAFRQCADLSSVELNDATVEIGNYSFATCTSLRHVRSNADITEIGDHAFYGCLELVEIDLNEGLESIGPNAFTACPKLREASLPSTVIRIDSSAFSDCAGLVYGRFHGNAPGDFGSGVFDSAAPGFSVLYKRGTSGFTTPIWNGYPCYPWSGTTSKVDVPYGTASPDKDSYAEGELVMLEAENRPGATFDHWSVNLPQYSHHIQSPRSASSFIVMPNVPLRITAIYDNSGDLEEAKFTDWLAGQGVPENQRGINDCPANDGVSNGVKYAFNHPAMTPAGMRDILAMSVVEGRMKIAFSIPNPATSMEIIVQYNETLNPSTWTAEGVGIELVNETAGERHYIATLPPGSGSQFTRIAFSLPQ